MAGIAIGLLGLRECMSAMCQENYPTGNGIAVFRSTLVWWFVALERSLVV